MTETTLQETVRLDIENGIATITIDRPKALNALSSKVLVGIHEAVRQAKEDAQAILLTGAGDKAFVAGADIAEMSGATRAEAEEFSRRGQEAFQALADFPGPTVAAINGFALGGGLELAMGCDILIASENAKLGLPETTLGLIPGFGGTQRLPRRVGVGMAKKLIFTGEAVDARTALSIGLVEEVVPAGQAYEAARALLQKALHNGPVAIREAKLLVDAGQDNDLRSAIDEEAHTFGVIFETQDAKEGIEAFLEKRKPAFQGN